MSCTMVRLQCALKMLAVLANETSAMIQFRLKQFLSYISPEERVAVIVKKNQTVFSS